MVVETPFGRSRSARVRRADGLAAQFARTPMTFTLIAVNTLVYVLEVLWGGRDLLQMVPVETMVRMGAVVPEANDALVWGRSLAYAYLHFNAIHLLVNMFALLNLGAALEPLLGSPRFFVLYTLSALGGGFLVTHFETQAVTAGASGALFGLLGAMAIVFWQLRSHSRSPEQRKELGSVVFRLLAPNLVISLLPGVSFLGHLGGLLVGSAYFGLGIFRVPRFRTPEQDARERRRDGSYRALAAVCTVLTVVAIGTVWLSMRPWTLASSAPRTA